MILNDLLTDVADGLAMVSALIEQLEEDYKETRREREELELRCAVYENRIKQLEQELEMRYKEIKKIRN